MGPVKLCCFLAFAMALVSVRAMPNVDPLGAVAEGEIEFAHDFYKQVSKNRPGNLVASPLSAHTVLSMAALGAAGQTAQEMRKSLRLPNNDELATNGLQGFIAALNNVQNATLNVANSIVMSNKLKLVPNYKKFAADVFRSDLVEADFNQVGELVKNVNKWVSGKTNDKISELLTKDDIQPNTRMILLNAIYFKSNWATKFDAEDTEDSDFYVDAQTVKKVPTMFAKKKFYNGRLTELDAKFVVLPYANKDLKMVIIVPDEIDGLPLIEQNVDKLTTNYLNERASKTDVNLFLPRFKIESSIELNKPLQDIGMQTMFSNNADFSGMTGDNSLYVGKVIQKAVIEVNEEGSEAAAATAAVMLLRMLYRTNIHVDKPFYYMIQSSQATLFHGRVVDPSV